MRRYVALIMAIVMTIMASIIYVGADNTITTRVPDAEIALNTAVYDNGDGTYTLNVYGMDIKYVNQIGEVADKSNRLVLDANNNYYNPDNDITMRFPQNLLAGVSLQL